MISIVPEQHKYLSDIPSLGLGVYTCCKMEGASTEDILRHILDFETNRNLSVISREVDL